MRIVVPERPIGRLSDAWRACVGTGRFELALRRDYQDSLALVQREIGFRHIRGHGLFSDGVGVHQPYEYRGARQVRHAFTYVDQIVDAYLDLGIALPVQDGRVELDLTVLDRHEVTLVEITAVTDETPQWTDEGRLYGGAGL